MHIFSSLRGVLVHNATVHTGRDRAGQGTGHGLESRDGIPQADERERDTANKAKPVSIDETEWTRQMYLCLVVLFFLYLDLRAEVRSFSSRLAFFFSSLISAGFIALSTTNCARCLKLFQ